MITIDGKTYTSKEEALEAIQKAKKVKKVGFSFPAQNKLKVVTNEGFTIDKEYLSALSAQMDYAGADFIRLTCEDCGTLNNKNVIITIRKGKAPWLERTLRKYNLIT